MKLADLWAESKEKHLIANRCYLVVNKLLYSYWNVSCIYGKFGIILQYLAYDSMVRYFVHSCQSHVYTM